MNDDNTGKKNLAVDKPKIDNPKTDPPPDTNTVKDPDDWTTGQESMTGAQASYLKTLSEKTNTPYEDGLTKAEASKRIDALRVEAGLAGGR